MEHALTDLTPKQVPARVIPVPSTVSPQLQRAIAASAAVSHDARLQVPQNVQQWKRMVAASNALTMQRISEILARFPANVALREVNGVAVRAITPRNLDPSNARRLLIHLHGGAYVINGGEASVGEGVLMAHHARSPVLSVDYRMPPDHPFPAALNDAVAVWQQLLEEHAPQRMAVFGASAGAGLALAMMLKLKLLGLPLPAALAPGTPWADLAGSGDSCATNAFIDE